MNSTNQRMENLPDRYDRGKIFFIREIRSIRGFISISEPLDRAGKFFP